MTNSDELASQLEEAHYQWTRALNSFGPLSAITAAKQDVYIAVRDALMAAVHAG